MLTNLINYERQSINEKAQITQGAFDSFVCGCTHAMDPAQIVLSTPKTTLGAVIKNIKSQSNYQFFYDDKLAETPVNAIDVKNGSLQSVLDAALQGKGNSPTR